MISADQFLEPARDCGYSFYTGVPCSFLTPLINRVISHSELTYVGATNEGEAAAIAAGAWLADKKAVVMCQNSGLGNTVNPLTSLNHPFRIPVLLIVTWRGQPGLHDEPQHALMGEITAGLLKLMQIEHAAFPQRLEDVSPTLVRLDGASQRTQLPVALIMAKGSVEGEPLDPRPVTIAARGHLSELHRSGVAPRRIAALERVLSVVGHDVAIVATTGKTGRELFTLADREQHLYLVGSMGCASGLGLGIALNCRRKILVLDGDGAALMKLGTMATVGAYRPSNLVHVILDNGVHDSTGGQATVSPNVDFGAAAVACGYRMAFDCHDLDSFEGALKDALEDGNGPALLHLRIAPGSIEKLGRPTISPYHVARRFKEFLCRAPAGLGDAHTGATQESAHAW
jgi:phosphonopyruvate decarboxylase